jgi:hypothetical protein
LVLAAFAGLFGCTQTKSSVEKLEIEARVEHADKMEAPQTSDSAEVGVVVGEPIAHAELRPVLNSGTTGTAVFKEVGNLGVQVELEVSDLPTKNLNTTYYAQVHEGSCSDEGTGKAHEEEVNGASFGPALALVTFDRILAKMSGLEAHGNHEPGIPEAPPGSIEQPVSFSASAEGTASVAALLEYGTPKQLTSGTPEYIHLHATGFEDAPEEFACGDLVSIVEGA